MKYRKNNNYSKSNNEGIRFKVISVIYTKISNISNNSNINTIILKSVITS